MLLSRAVGTLVAQTLLPPSILMSGSMPAMEVLYAQNSGTEVVGSLIEVLGVLQTALCTANGDGNVYACAAFETQRQALWTFFAASVCGMPSDGWSGTLSGAPVDAAVELLLAQCASAYAGDLSLLAQQVVSKFTSYAAALRTDVSAVVAANAALAGVNLTTATTAETNALYASFYPPLAPIPAAGREPAVLTAQPPPPLVAAEYELYVNYSPAAAPWAASTFPETAFPDATIQSPDALSTAVLSGAPGRTMYMRWLEHPSALARFSSAYCSTAAWNDDICFPPIVAPLIGYTHDAYGNRLLSDRGEPL